METYIISGVKIGTKTVLNTACPGSGSLIDFGEAIYDICNGDCVSAATNMVSGVLDLFTLGFYGTSKAAAKETAKHSAVTVVKQTSKSTTKAIGKEAGKQIASGMPKTLAINMAKTSAKQAKKELGKTFGKEIATGMLHEATEEAFRRSVSMAMFCETGLSLIGSGGNDIKKEIIEGLARGWFDEAFKTAGRRGFTSATFSAAKKGATYVADDYFIKVLAKDSVFNYCKFVSKLRDDRE